MQCNEISEGKNIIPSYLIPANDRIHSFIVRSPMIDDKNPLNSMSNKSNHSIQGTGTGHESGEYSRIGPKFPIWVKVSYPNWVKVSYANKSNHGIQGTGTGHASNCLI